jgi:hypothetical protein
MNGHDRERLIRDLQNTISDSELDAMTTDDLEKLILRARFALKRRAEAALAAIGSVDTKLPG